MALPAHRTDRPNAAFGGRALMRKAASFGLVGVLNGLIDAAVFFAALAYLTGSLVAANVLGWLVAVSFSYAANSYTTFARESGRRLRLRDYGGFVASGIAGLFANTATLVIAALFLPVWAAKACAILASFLVNFTLSNFVVFRPRGRPDGNAGDRS